MIFRKGFKYQLQEDEIFISNIYPPEDVFDGGFIELSKTGILKVRKGFAWDGPSGPAIATADFMRGSLAHDALYGLMCNGFLDKSWRKEADDLLIEVCKEDGMPAFRRWYVYKCVRWFGGYFLSPEKNYEV